MTAGRRDTLISFGRFSTITDDYGEETQGWAIIGDEWAAVFYGRGDERRQAAMEQGQQAATFQVLSNNLTQSLSIKDRISLSSADYDIVGIAPMNRSEIELTAVRVA